MPTNILKLLEGKWEDGTRPKDLFKNHIAGSPKMYIQLIIDGLRNGNRKVENGCAELAALLAEHNPKLLYPHVDLFIAGLRAKEKMLRWEAVCTLGYLAVCDKEQKIPPHIATIIAFLKNESIVLQGHALRSLARIAVAYPGEAGRIFKAMTDSKDDFPNNKIGFLIEAMAAMCAVSEVQEPIRKFVIPFKNSNIPVVARKAKKALKVINRDN